MVGKEITKNNPPYLRYLRFTVELDPEDTTFQHVKGKRLDDDAEKKCSPWAGENEHLFNQACPQVWGKSGEHNGKWVGYDADCPLQMNGGSGQFAAAHVLIKIGNKKLPGEWVIPLSHLANTYANAGIFKTGRFQPTLGYTAAWHSLRVSVTAIKTASH